MSGAWETVLLWIHRVPFSPTASVTDPIFHRDISFFLFELPFLRLVQGVFNGIVVAALLLSLTRYLVSASNGGLVFLDPVRIHLAVLGGLFLLSVAFGYQLDKLDLSYSTRGVAAGVSYTDQNAQFLAFDVLTVISGIAAALLVGGGVHADALAAGADDRGLVRRLARDRPAVPGGRSSASRSTPNQYAQESPYIGNNIAMTRLAFDVGNWTNDVPFNGTAVLTPDQVARESLDVRERPAVGSAPAPDEPRPAPDRAQVLRLHRRRHRPLPDRRRSSARSCSRAASSRSSRTRRRPAGSTSGSSTPTASASRWCRSTRPAARASRTCSSATCRRPRRPVRPTITQPRIYFGERPSSYVVTGAQEDEFDYPTGETDTGGSVGAQTRWTGTTGVKLDTTLMRLLFAARFRDLDLLISNQVTADSQLLFHRYLSDRLTLIAPFLRYDKDPYLVIDGSGNLVYIQDAFTTSDRFPDAQPFDPGSLVSTNLGSDEFNYIRNSVKITVNAYDGTMHFYVADPDDPIIRAYEGIFPTLFEPIDSMPSDLRAHIRVPEELFNVQTQVFGRYHVTDPLQFFRRDDLWTVPTGATSDTRLPSQAYYVEMHLPGETGVEFLLLQPMVPVSRPNMIAWVAARNDGANYGSTRRLPVPGRHDDLRTGPDRGPDRPGSDDQRAGLAVEPVGQQGHLRQPHRAAARRRAHLSPAGLPPVDRIGLPGLHPDRGRLAARGGLGVDAQRCPQAAAGGRGERPTARALAAADAGPVARGVSPGRHRSPGPVATPGPTPGVGLPNDVAGLIDYANRHFELAQARAAQQRLRHATGRRWPSSRQPSSDSRSSPRAWRHRARGRRPARRREPRGGADRCAARDARDPGHLAAGTGRVPAPRRLPARHHPDRRAADAGRPRQRAGAVDHAARVGIDHAGLRRGVRRRRRASSLGWLVIGGWAAAALEAEGARIVARVSSDDRPASGATADSARIAVRIMAARILAYVPLMLALAWASVRVVWTAYLELTNPSDASVSIVVRILRSSPDVLVALVLAWMVGEMRRGGRGSTDHPRSRRHLDRACAAGSGRASADPLATARALLAPDAGPDRRPRAMRPSPRPPPGPRSATVLGDGSDAIRVLVSVVLFVAVWIVGLVLTAVVCAWRAAVWTMADVLERRTFGGSSDRRPGDWRDHRSSANV